MIACQQKGRAYPARTPRPAPRQSRAPDRVSLGSPDYVPAGPVHVTGTPGRARRRSLVNSRQQGDFRQLARCWREYALLRDRSKDPADSTLTGANAISREIPAADPELARPPAGDLDMC